MSAPAIDMRAEAAAWLADHPEIRAHASLSPSSASGWMTCPDYPNANDGLPDDESEFAREGTIAHEISENCLAHDFEPHDFIGMKTRHKEWSFEWTADDSELLQPGIDWTREQPGKFFGEHQVDLSRWLGDGQFGTLDRGIVAPDLITIADLKWGRGIPVSPVRNKQLRIYALGFWWNVARHHSKATDFRIVIDQPRNSAGGGEWRTTLDELLAFGEEAMRAAEATRAPNPPRVASYDGCLWCKRRQQPPSEPGALSGCKTYDAFNLALISAEFEDLDGGEFDDLQVPCNLTPDRRAYLLRHRSMLDRWLDGIHADTLRDALGGQDAGGLKAVAGKQGRRVFADKDKAKGALVPLLGDRSFNMVLITPTEAGRRISSEDYGKFIAPHVKRADPKPILVPVEDERPALLTADEFEDLPETDA